MTKKNKRNHRAHPGGKKALPKEVAASQVPVEESEKQDLGEAFRRREKTSNDWRYEHSSSEEDSASDEQREDEIIDKAKANATRLMEEEERKKEAKARKEERARLKESREAEANQVTGKETNDELMGMLDDLI